METIDGMQLEEIICVRLDYGDDFHECIEQVARERDIQSGVILSGIGTFDRARIHHITHTRFPAEDKFVELEGPIELVSVSGIIADYQPHMHCTMAVRGDELFSGHLEPGCNILYLGEVVIGRLSGKRLTRDRHPERDTPRLVVKQ
jgi:predicted DNA-binding protein with PD1-like motif